MRFWITFKPHILIVIHIYIDIDQYRGWIWNTIDVNADPCFENTILVILVNEEEAHLHVFFVGIACTKRLIA